jgi:hypothetical protein
MGNKLSTRDKRIIIISSGIISSLILIKIGQFFYYKTQDGNVKNLLQNSESLQDILQNKQISTKDKIHFQKDENYTKSIEEIQKLNNEISLLKKNNAPNDQTLELQKKVIKLIHMETWNLWIMCNVQIFESNRTKRRLKIDNLTEYIHVMQSEFKQDEIILFLCKKEVLGDAKMTSSKYEKEFESLFEIIPSFFIELEVTAEFEKVLRRPHRKKELLSSDIEDYYKKSISILKEIENKNLFDFLKNKVSSSVLSLIVQNYIDDRIAIRSDIEKEDITKRREFLKNSSIQKLKGKYNDMFLNLFPE